jgi:hypothetical protein
VEYLVISKLALNAFLRANCVGVSRRQTQMRKHVELDIVHELFSINVDYGITGFVVKPNEAHYVQDSREISQKRRVGYVFACNTTIKWHRRY